MQKISTMIIPEAMLINKPKNDQDLIARLNSGRYFGEIKKDGCWYQLVKTDTGDIHLFSRTKSKKTGFFVDKIDNVPHIKEWAAECLPNSTILLGEIYYPGYTSKDVTKVMGCLPEKAIERQQNNPIHYYLFDILMFDGFSLLDEGNLQRYTKLDTLITAKPETWDSWLEIAQVYTSNLAAKLDDVFNCGEEGMVFKKIDGLYQPGKRPVYNIKAKTEDTVDAVIMKFVAPEKQYTGSELKVWPYWEDGIPVTKPYFYKWNMGFVIGAYDKNNQLIPIGFVTSGLTDQMREDSARNPINYIGKVAEIQCMSADKDAHTLRHPRLIQVRPDGDKAPQDCTIESIFS